MFSIVTLFNTAGTNRREDVKCLFSQMCYRDSFEFTVVEYRFIHLLLVRIVKDMSLILLQCFKYFIALDLFRSFDHLNNRFSK
jgi:hypothetical protein